MRFEVVTFTPGTVTFTALVLHSTTNSGKGGTGTVTGTLDTSTVKVSTDKLTRLEIFIFKNPPCWLGLGQIWRGHV